MTTASDSPPDSTTPLELYFDESGFTGARLLDPAQPFFSYASVAISDAEAWQILEDARRRHPVQMPELKAQRLLSSPTGIALLEDVLAAVEGRYTFVIQQKLVVLCGKVFEYLFEPVFKDDPSLLYRKNLHRFVAMYCYIFFIGPEGKAAITQFERYMRTLDPAEAPLLFDPALLDTIDDNDPFKSVVRFAQGYKSQIIADNERMRTAAPAASKWALDVSISGLWSLLNHWGQSKRLLRVTCDDSKPLRDQVAALTGDEDDPGIFRAKAISGRPEQFGWQLDRPIAFGDSRSHPGLQIADLIAGAASRAPLRGGEDTFKRIGEALDRHVHHHSIMPDFSHVQLGTMEVDVNWLVLLELGERARRGDNPAAGLAAFYHSAERTWTPGLFGRT